MCVSRGRLQMHPAPIVLSPVNTLMNFSPQPQPRPIVTPCIGICTMAADGLCEGCARTLDEITHWGSFNDEQRRVLMDELLPAREVARG